MAVQTNVREMRTACHFLRQANIFIKTRHYILRISQGPPVRVMPSTARHYQRDSEVNQQFRAQIDRHLSCGTAAPIAQLAANAVGLKQCPYHKRLSFEIQSNTA